jgi:hypothetical protein
MDDYHCVPEAKRAVDNWREWHGITAPLITESDRSRSVGVCSVYWRAESRLGVDTIRYDVYDEFNRDRIPANVIFSFWLEYTAKRIPVAIFQYEGQRLEDAISAHCATVLTVLPPDTFGDIAACQVCQDSCRSVRHMCPYEF